MKKPVIYKKRDNGIFYYRLASERTFHSTGQKNPQLAEWWVQENILKGTKPKVTPTLADYAIEAFDEYVELCRGLNKPLSVGYAKRQRRLIERFVVKAPIARKPVSEINVKDSEGFERWLAKKLGDRHATVKAAFAAYQTVIRRAIKEDLIDKDPTRGMDRFRAATKERTTYSLKELNKLFPKSVWKSGKFSPWSGPEDYTAFLLAASTGMRKGEVLALKWGAVHPEKGKEYIELKESLTDYGSVKPPKSNRPRATPIFDFIHWKSDRRAVTALRNLRKQRVAGLRGDADEIAASRKLDDQPVFGYADGSYRKGTWWAKHLEKALANAEIQRDRGDNRRRLDAHSFRHTLGSHLKVAGLSDDLIRQFCGWSSAQMQANYTHIEGDVLNQLLEHIRRVQ